MGVGCGGVGTAGVCVQGANRVRRGGVSVFETGRADTVGWGGGGDGKVGV